MAEARAARFLQQSTFGYTKTQAEQLASRIIEVGQRAAFEQWIDGQFLLTPTLHLSTMREMLVDDGVDLDDGENHVSIYNADDYRYHAWWDIALNSPDQLTQRIAWALAQIFVVNDFDSRYRSSDPDAFGVLRYFGASYYYDTLVQGSSGSYPALLEAVSKHPVMGEFLSHVNNRKASGSRFPDENFAREIMQLFSIGIHELAPNGELLLDDSGGLIETYSNATIRTLARVFTGWHYAGESPGRNNPTWSQPMVVDPSRHDEDEKDLTDLRNGILIPAATAAEQELTLVVNMLTGHPNTAPFISRLLIQRFTMSSPPAAYVEEVADVFRATNGNFQAVVKTLLLSEHNLDNYEYQPIVSTRSGRTIGMQIFNGGTERTRLIEPVIRLTQFLKLFNASSDYTGGRIALPNLEDDIGQSPYRSPTVFNFYSPFYPGIPPLSDYVPIDVVQDTLVVPEFELVDTTTIIDSADFYREWILDALDDGNFFRLQYGGGNRVEREMNVLLDFQPWQNILDRQRMRALLDQLNIHLCGGNFTQDFLRDVYRIVRSEAESPSDYVPGTILAILESPACLVR
ncbi:MAG: DUF1800 family protein [Pseudomonadota bacterium]